MIKSKKMSRNLKSTNKKRAAGFVPIQLWVKPEQKEKIKKFAQSLNN